MVASLILPHGVVRPLWLSVSLLMIVVAGCAGPHSNGAAWAARNLDAERRMFQLGEARRAQMAQAFQVGLADETLAAEQQRMADGLQSCPGPREAFVPSAGDASRDTVRLRAQGDSNRTRTLAEVALADWFVRRARSTGDAAYCERARAALDGTLPGVPAGDLLASVADATVTRDTKANPVPVDGGTLTDYALGYVDAVTGAAPLPQYLSLVYGGVVLDTAAARDAQTAARMVDEQAAAYPQWEPDALYAALRGGAWP